MDTYPVNWKKNVKTEYSPKDDIVIVSVIVSGNIFIEIALFKSFYMIYYTFL